MFDLIHPPWSPLQVATLNRLQRSGLMHPFTCCGEAHAFNSPTLIATANGWRCPRPECDYRQDWAHSFMADPEAVAALVESDPLRALLGFDDCSSHACRKPGVHSLVWGECAHASPPPPPATWEQDPLQALTDLIRANQWTTQTMDDGYTSIAPATAEELAALVLDMVRPHLASLPGDSGDPFSLGPYPQPGDWSAAYARMAKLQVAIDSLNGRLVSNQRKREREGSAAAMQIAHLERRIAGMERALRKQAVDARQLHGAQIAYGIRAEFVCCMIYDDVQAGRCSRGRVGSHWICYWGEAAARIAETPSRWQDDPDECAQGCPPQCRHRRAADEHSRLSWELEQQHPTTFAEGVEAIEAARRERRQQ